MASKIKKSVAVLGFVSVIGAIIQGLLLILSYGMGGATIPVFIFGLVIIHFILLLTALGFYFFNPSKKSALTILSLGLLAYVYPLFVAVFMVRPSFDFLEFFLGLGIFGLIPAALVIFHIRSIVSTIRTGR